MRVDVVLFYMAPYFCDLSYFNCTTVTKGSFNFFKPKNSFNGIVFLNFLSSSIAIVTRNVKMNLDIFDANQNAGGCLMSNIIEIVLLVQHYL